MTAQSTVTVMPGQTPSSGGASTSFGDVIVDAYFRNCWTDRSNQNTIDSALLAGIAAPITSSVCVRRRA